jgi:hypothetical protein
MPGHTRGRTSETPPNPKNQLRVNLEEIGTKMKNRLNVKYIAYLKRRKYLALVATALTQLLNEVTFLPFALESVSLY